MSHLEIDHNFSKKFSPEWYSFYLHESLSCYHETIFSHTSSKVLSHIIDLIAEFSRGIRCFYLAQPGYTSQLANLCIIGRNSSDLHLSNASFTIEAWINLKYTSHQIGAMTAIQGDQTIVGGRFLADEQALHITIRHGCPHFGFSLRDRNRNITALDCILECNTWYHLAFVYDILTKKQLIYVNGILEASKNRVEALKGDRDLCISHFFQGRPLFGYITELRIWNIAQSEKNINKYMNKIDIGEYEIDLINSGKCKDFSDVKYDGNDYYRYNNGTGNGSGNNSGNDGIILRKCFSMTENMEWKQKVRSKHEQSFDHLIQYND